MDLPDCPPGAEGYEDTVVEIPKKVNQEDGECTKAEQEFQDHLNSLKIKVEHVGARSMVERRGRDVSGKWIYLCYPCAAVCSGESILQTHISGKKHKTKLSMRTIWPQSIFDEHPYLLSEKGITKDKGSKDGATEKVLQKMAEEVSFYNKSASDLDRKYNVYRNVRCHLQDTLDSIKAPLVGLEYLVEHPPEEEHYEPSYMCTLCHKQGHPRTIINHMTCFWHRYNYLTRHYTKAVMLLSPYKSTAKYREGVNVIINRLMQRIQDTYGRLKPINIDKEEYEKDRDVIHQWICKSHHFSEKDGPTFEEVVDIGLIESLNRSNDGKRFDNRRDPSPPIVAAPTKPLFNNYTRPPGRQERRVSPDALSDISDEPDPRRREAQGSSQRFEPYRDRQESPSRHHRYTNKMKTVGDKDKKPNYDYKVKLAAEQRQHAQDALQKTLAYHEKNPEKHPLYPEEWKKFWNRRYKEIQADGKDPSKHDFKPEWITYWTGRMKELHEQELRVQIGEIYRRMCLPVPDQGDEKKPREASPERRRSPEPRRRSPEPRRRSPDPRRRSPTLRRRSPDLRRRSPIPRRRSPDVRRRSPDPRRRSPGPRRRTPERRKSPAGSDRFRWKKDDDRNRRDYRSSERRGIDARPELPRGPRSRSPISRSRSPARALEVESVRRSRSPLSRRAAAPLRNRSPARRAPSHPSNHSNHPDLAPSMQTVLISDDELKPDDSGLSPWNSENESLGSLPEARSPARASRSGSEASRIRRDPHRARAADVADLGPPENVVATLRLLVALEDYLGSLGPKIVDLLTEALKMEKEKANSSEELLEREASVGLVETAKEKLKGAVQAGLVPPPAAPAVRAAIVRAAATLHAADLRRPTPHQQKAVPTVADGSSVPVAGVGAVDRASIAQQMAAALIAQGKTDVSSDELAQLVDAVVGMAEAKKREAEVKKKVEARAAERQSRAPAAAVAGKTASALQMLQSAYDENEKRIEKEDAPDAMDGLSDSDLETLLKNFNELSAEEQHSLIAYLKKLEAREPQRVEKLRQYVSAADDPPASPAPASAPAPAPLGTVTVESDDDDYAVEEVFQSATQKVKEDQMRQEMEIVKKSLEESTKAITPLSEAPGVEAAKHTSSATDLFALVQASLHSTAAPAAAVVAAHTQPRSFGDAPDPAPAPASAPAPAPTPTLAPAPPALDPAPAPHHLLSTFLNKTDWNQSPPTQDARPREPLLADPPSLAARDQFDPDPRASLVQGGRGPFNQNARGPFDQDNRGGFNQDGRGGFNQDGRGGFNQNSRGGFNQDNRGTFSQDGRGPFNQDSRGPFTQDNRGTFNQDNNIRGPFNQGARGPFNQDVRTPFNPDNRGSFNQGNRPPLIPDNRAPFNQDNRGPTNQAFNTDNRVPLLQDTPSMQNASFPMQGNRAPLIQDNRPPLIQDNRPPLIQDNRPGPGFNNFGLDNTNQFNRGNNFMNGRMQDNAWQDQQQQHQQQQQYGNFEQQKNFRGRGRGNFGGPMRGRGRGNFY